VLHAELERIGNHLDVAVRPADAAGLAVGDRPLRAAQGKRAAAGKQDVRQPVRPGVVVPFGVSALPRIGPAQILAELARLENASRRMPPR
jgi:hypothetical protein